MCVCVFQVKQFLLIFFVTFSMRNSHRSELFSGFQMPVRIMDSVFSFLWFLEKYLCALNWIELWTFILMGWIVTGNHPIAPYNTPKWLLSQCFIFWSTLFGMHLLCILVFRKHKQFLREKFPSKIEEILISHYLSSISSFTLHWKFIFYKCSIKRI